jgi:16S rRNA (cytidine1402-2'-O)-methyltransferase
VCMCREMTKMYEEIRRGTAEELLAWAGEQEILGEITLVVGPTTLEEVSTDDAAIEAAVDKCLAAGLSARDTASAVAVLLDVSRKQVYSLCLKRSDKR